MSSEHQPLTAVRRTHQYSEIAPSDDAVPLTAGAEKAKAKTRPKKTKTFITGSIHVERIDTSEQNFVATGWINFLWRGEHPVKREDRKKYNTYGPRDNIWRELDDENDYPDYAEEQLQREELERIAKAKTKDDKEDDNEVAGGGGAVSVVKGFDSLATFLQERFQEEKKKPKKFVDPKKAKFYKPFGGGASWDQLGLVFGGNGNEVESLLEGKLYGIRFAELYDRPAAKPTKEEKKEDVPLKPTATAINADAGGLQDEEEKKEDVSLKLIATAINTDAGQSQDKEEKKENMVLFWQYLYFRGTFDEFFEMEEFPFDKQFLNVPFKYHSSKWEAVAKASELGVGDLYLFRNEKEKGNAASLSQPVNCKLIDSVWTKEWQLLDPWLVFAGVENTSAHDFALIKLRVVRKPLHIIWFTLLPVFLITSCIFVIWALVGGDPIDEMNNRLAVVFTLLLTIQASQIAATEGMPKLPTTTIVDKYIAFSIFMQVLTIPFVIVSALAFDADDDERASGKNLFELVGGIAFLASWIVASFLAFGGKNWFHRKPCNKSWRDRLEEEDKQATEDRNSFKRAQPECIRVDQNQKGFQFPNAYDE